MIQFDEHIFQTGWCNHHLGNVCRIHSKCFLKEMLGRIHPCLTNVCLIVFFRCLINGFVRGSVRKVCCFCLALFGHVMFCIIEKESTSNSRKEKKQKTLEKETARTSHSKKMTHNRNVYLSSVQNPGWLGYIGDEILPSYAGIIINHYKIL